MAFVSEEIQFDFSFYFFVFCPRKLCKLISSITTSVSISLSLSFRPLNLLFFVCSSDVPGYIIKFHTFVKFVGNNSYGYFSLKNLWCKTVLSFTKWFYYISVLLERLRNNQIKNILSFVPRIKVKKLFNLVIKSAMFYLIYWMLHLW